MSNYFDSKELNKYIDGELNIIMCNINEDLENGDIIRNFDDCSLMCGICSIAYGIMKLENMDIPNVLCLE